MPEKRKRHTAEFKAKVALEAVKGVKTTTEDRRFHELVAARNQADNMIHATRKSMEQLGDKMEAGEKQGIEAAIKKLEEAVKGDDQDRIERLTKELGDAAGKLAERLYAQQQEPPGRGGGAGGESPGGGASGGKDDVVDAEFEEVKDDRK